MLNLCTTCAEKLVVKFCIMHIYSLSKFYRKINSKLFDKNILSQTASKFWINHRRKVCKNKTLLRRKCQKHPASLLPHLGTTNTSSLMVHHCLAIMVSMNQLMLNWCINCSSVFNQTIQWNIKFLICICPTHNTYQSTYFDCMCVVCVPDPPSLPLKYYSSEHDEAILTCHLGDNKYHEILEVQAVLPMPQKKRGKFVLSGNFTLMSIYSNCILCVAIAF